MAAYNKFQGFVGYLGLGAVNLNTDTLMVYLTNNVPDAALDDVKADLAGITEENGYAAADITNLYSEAAGTGTMTATDVPWTAVGGPLEQARYVVMYDDTHANDILIGWWDYGSAFTVLEGESFTVNFAASVFTIA